MTSGKEAKNGKADIESVRSGNRAAGPLLLRPATEMSRKEGHGFRLFSSLVAVSMIAFAGHAVSSRADDINPRTLKDLERITQSKPAFIQHLIDSGSVVSYLGSFQNYRSYLAESKTGKMVTINISSEDPTGNTAIIGDIVTADGECVTCEQYGRINDRIRAARTQGRMKASSATTDPAPASNSQSPLSSLATGSGSGNNGNSSVSLPGVAKPLSLADIRKEQEEDASGNTSSKEPAGSKEGNASIYLAHVKWDEFSKAANSSGYFDVGQKNAPLLYMIADPHCPFCHRAWARLRPMVMAGKLRVRVILTRALPGSEVDTHNLLGNDNIGQAWMRGEGSVEGYPVTATQIPGSRGYEAADRAYQYNVIFANKYLAAEAPEGSPNGGTPFLAYKGTDGRFYASEGPSDLDGFLSMIGMK